MMTEVAKMLTSVLFCQVLACGKPVEKYVIFCGKTCGIANSAVTICYTDLQIRCNDSLRP